MNYQRNAIFAIALLGLLVLSACATTDENVVGEAIKPVRHSAEIAINGNYLTLAEGETGVAPVVQCVNSPRRDYEVTLLYVDSTRGTKASVNGELTRTLKVGETQVLMSGISITPVWIDPVKNSTTAKFSVDGYLTRSIAVGQTESWSEGGEVVPCQVTLVSVR